MISVPENLYRLKRQVEDNPIWQRLRRNVSISIVGSGLVLAIKLGQTALLTKLLRIDDYARVLIVLNLFVFLDSLFGLRVSDLMFRFFPLLKEQSATRAVTGLLWLCLGICLASALIIYGAVFVLSPWLGDRFYPNLGLTPLFRIYGCTILFSSFSGVYEPALRIYNRFTAIVAPQVMGSLLTLALLCIYFATGSTTNGDYSLKPVVAAFAAGALIQSAIPLMKSLFLLKPLLSGTRIKEAMRLLRPHRRAITACLMNSNLSGTLKFAISPGDVFFMGLFSAPAQLAWFGLAKQLTAPLAFLQTNIQTAIYPEVSSLVAGRKFGQLKRLLTRYLTRTLTVGSLLLITVILLGRFWILHVVGAEYAAALPVFYLLAVAAWLMLAFLVFRPLALNMDLLRWHNLALLISSGILVLVIVAGKLNALTMAYIQLAEVLILRSLFGILVGTRLRRLAREE